MKFKPGNLYQVYKKFEPDDLFDSDTPYCIKHHDFIDIKISDIFLFLEVYRSDGIRYPTTKINKIFFNGEIYCFGAEQLNESNCKLIVTDDIKNNNWVIKISKNILNLFV